MATSALAAAPPPAALSPNPARRALAALSRDQDVLVGAWADAFLAACDARDPGDRPSPPPTGRPAVRRRRAKMVT
jgi:hypothetical protein